MLSQVSNIFSSDAIFTVSCIEEQTTEYFFLRIPQMILSCRHLHIDSFVETWQLENGGKVPSPYSHCASAYREQNQFILWMKRKLSIFGLRLGPIKRS